MTPAVQEASRTFMQASDRLPTLWALTEEFRELVDLLEQPEPDQDAIATELTRVAADITKKAYGIAIVIQGIENKAAMLKAEEARLNAKRKACENAAERLRAYTLAQMQALGQERIDTGTFLLSVRLNNPSVVVLDAAAIPSEYQRTTISIAPDKVAILAAMKATGEVIPGTEVVRTPRLEIK
jgi:hypothetical protein